MIKYLSGRQRETDRDVFEKLFRARSEVFIGKLNWSLPTKNGLDIDQYDNERAHYFYALNEDGTVKAHARMTPSLTDSLLADYFPHLVEDGSDPRGKTIYEGTRLFLTPNPGSRQIARSTMSQLMVTMFEAAQEIGVTQIQTVIEASTLSMYIELSEEVTPIGLIRPYGGGASAPGGGAAIAIRCPVSNTVIEQLRAYGRKRTRLNGSHSTGSGVGFI